MVHKILMCGNEACGEGAILAGCTFYAGYPITPQNELTAYIAKRMNETGGMFIQAESELAAINMVFGAAATGKRSMTSSSSPGISLMQEGISYLAAAELPCVVVNVMRGEMPRQLPEATRTSCPPPTSICSSRWRSGWASGR